jgi:hypothetical protein
MNAVFFHCGWFSACGISRLPEAVVLRSACSATLSCAAHRARAVGGERGGGVR